MRTRDLGIFACLAVLLAVTRWPLAPKYLFYFDSVNMAYALEVFNPQAHQPQPPGYPLYVAFCRLISALGFTVEDTFLVSGVLAGAITGVLLWRFGVDTQRPRAGMLAALVFAFTPVFWFNSLTNQSRGFSAVASAGTAWLCWRASRAGSHPGWLLAAAAFVGTLAGFRPVETAMLSPLLLWAVWLRRPSVPQLGAAVLAGALPVLVWGWWLLAASGGLNAYIALMQGYSRDEAIFAAGAAPNPWRVLFKSLEFVGAMHLVCVLPWLWALAWKRPVLTPGSGLRGEGIFLLVWLLPGLAFQVIGHAADPCHSLATIAGLCWLGGLTLHQLPGRMPWAGVAVACVLGTALFLHPLRGAARATSYDVIRRVDKAVSGAIDTIRGSTGEGPLVIVVRDTLVTWRHLRYYFPEAAIWVEGAGEPQSPSGATEFPPPADARVFVVDRNGTHAGFSAALPR